MRRKHNSDATEKCNALFELRSGYSLNTARSRCARFQFNIESSWICSSAQQYFPCVFPPTVIFWSEICHVLDGTNRTNFLYLWTADNESTKKAYAPLMTKFMSFISAVRLAIRIKFELQNLPQLMLEDIDRLVKRYAQVGTPCSLGGMAWTLQSFGRLLFLHN